MRRLSFIFVVFFAIPSGYTLDYAQDVRPFLQTYCIECHGGKKVKGKVDFTKMKTDADLSAAFETWEAAIELLKEGEMPPDAAKQPSAANLDVIYQWYQQRFVESVKAHPGYFKPRRLSAWEYRHTLHSLFGFDMETAVIEAQQTVTEKSLVMKLLPTDPPGKSGFKNDTSGNPLSTVIWDQCSYLAEEAIVRFLEKNPEIEPKDVIRRFLPRAVRRSLPEHELAKVSDRVNSEADLKRELKTVLMSPGFIYRGILMEGEKDTEIDVDQFELAERLSYFLWNDMPDDELFRIAASGQIRAQIKQQVDRMLKSPKSHRFAENFATQWLALDSMDQFANREVTIAVALKEQPIEFFNYLITENRPLLELIDSRVTYANPILAKFYRNDRKQIAPYRKAQGIEKEIVPHNRITLENTKGRGGIMTMPGILAMNRGPVQRGLGFWNVSWAIIFLSRRRMSARWSPIARARSFRFDNASRSTAAIRPARFATTRSIRSVLPCNATPTTVPSVDLATSRSPRRRKRARTTTAANSTRAADFPAAKPSKISMSLNNFCSRNVAR